MGDDDGYIFCGTSLPDPEDGPSAQKRARRELQVRDEKGRQRFHGAFTGGFSAGYFNTVGTKEGWTPSTFVSSRSKAAEHVVQNPEDFMDAEDFGEFGIAPRKIHTTAKFRDGAASEKRKTPMFSDAVIPGEPPLKELVQPVAENIGFQILMKMGWKPGQGIGPRVKRAGRRVSGVDETYASPDSFSEADDPMLASFTFAPKDTTSLPYMPKDDYHGIGYTGLSTKSVLSTPAVGTSNVTKSWLEKSKKKLLISGKAFGIGALEDDDDIEIYNHEDMSQYDFSELAGNQAEMKETEKSAHRNNRGFDGVLNGFVKSEKTVTVRKKFPLPQLPAGYTPVRKSVHTSGESVSATSKHQVLTAEDRSLILGERKLITMAFKSTSSPAPKPVAPAEQRLATGANAVPSGFQPFINDPEKQKRYKEYLKLEQKECIKTLQPAHMTEWEKQQELEEFSHAAALYQPLSSMLSSRFVSRSHLEAEGQGGIVKVEKSSPEKVIPSGPSHEKTEWHPASLLCKRFNIPNPYPNSSSVGVPNSGRKQKFLFDCLSFEGEKKQTAAVDVQDIGQEEKAMPSTKPESKGSLGPEVEDPKIVPLLGSASEEIAPGVKKPPIDLFKAIFENTSDEDSSLSDRSDGEAEKEACSLVKHPMTDVTSQQGNTSNPVLPAQNRAPKKAFGVFANIDLDMLNSSYVPPSDMTATACTEPNVSSQSADTSMSLVSFSEETDGKQQQEEASAISNESVYGPRLPPPGFTPSRSESKTRSHKHSSQKEHKHHKHKKKKKKKNKKHKKQSFSKESPECISIDSSSSDDDDIDPSVIIKKLNDLHNKSVKKYCKY